MDDFSYRVIFKVRWGLLTVLLVDSDRHSDSDGDSDSDGYIIYNYRLS